RLLLLVDRLKLPPDVHKPLVLPLVAEAGHVFKEIDLWQGVAKDSQILLDCICARVVETPGVAECPVSGFGEWLTRRASSQKRSIAHSESGSLEKLLRCDGLDRLQCRGSANDWPSAVHADHVSSVTIHLDGDSNFKPRGL